MKNMQIFKKLLIISLILFIAFICENTASATLATETKGTEDVGVDTSLPDSSDTRIKYYDNKNSALKYDNYDDGNEGIETAGSTETGPIPTYLQAPILVSNIYYYEPVELRFNLYELFGHSLGDPIAGRTITFTVDGDPATYTTPPTDEDGCAIYTGYIVTSTSEADIYAYFAGDGLYQPSYSSGLLLVTGRNTQLQTYSHLEVDIYETIDLWFRLLGEDTNSPISTPIFSPLPGRTITFTVDGDPTKYTVITDEDGEAIYSYLFTQEYCGAIYVNFAGDIGYLPDNYDMPIFYTATNTSIYVDNKSGYLNDTIDLTATLKDEDGNPMAGETITFSVTGDPNTYTAITNSYGRATYTVYKIMQHAGFIYANFPGTIGNVASAGFGTLFLNPTPETIQFPHTTNQHPLNQASYPVNTSTVPMPATGSPLAIAAIGLLSIIGGTIYGKLR